MITIVQVLLGIVVLTAGRKLFWLFVGAVGFIIAINLAGQFFTTESEVVRLVIALVAGVVGAVLALFLQRIAIGVAGFLVGGYGLLLLLNSLGIAIDLPSWLIFLIGGIIGAGLVAVLFDWALIILSALVGANLIVGAINTGPLITLLLTLVLFLAGVGVQASARRGEAPKPPRPSRGSKQTPTLKVG